MNPDGPILVTGAAGCIGAWVVAHFVHKGADVIAFDLSGDRRRLELVIDAKRADAVPWVVGDIADPDAVEAAAAEHRVGAVIHLAALQLPFCKADPVAGARVNVGGLVNVLEAARRQGVRHIVYASSIAALPARPDDATPATLYGAFKAADENIAQAYWRELRLPSIGLRPGPVFGPGRDQGLTSMPTLAMLAAAIGRRFTISFTGRLLFQYVGEVAKVFARCATLDVDAAHVFNLGGTPVSVDEIISEIRGAAPAAEIDSRGGQLPFPAEVDDTPLRRLIGDWQETTLEQGVRRTVAAFRDLYQRGLVGPDNLDVSESGIPRSA